MSTQDHAKTLTWSANNLFDKMEDNAHIGTYGLKASTLVFVGYAFIWTKFGEMCQRGIFAKNEVLSHKLHASDWTPPPLLDSRQLLEFTGMIRMTDSEDVLRAIWYILQNVCGERVLTPVLRLNPDTGVEEARLMR